MHRNEVEEYAQGLLDGLSSMEDQCVESLKGQCSWDSVCGLRGGLEAIARCRGLVEGSLAEFRRGDDGFEKEIGNV